MVTVTAADLRDLAVQLDEAIDHLTTQSRLPGANPSLYFYAVIALTAAARDYRAEASQLDAGGPT